MFSRVFDRFLMGTCKLSMRACCEPRGSCEDGVLARLSLSKVFLGSVGCSTNLVKTQCTFQILYNCSCLFKDTYNSQHNQGDPS